MRGKLSLGGVGENCGGRPETHDLFGRNELVEFLWGEEFPFQGQLTDRLALGKCVLDELRGGGIAEAIDQRGCGGGSAGGVPPALFFDGFDSLDAARAKTSQALVSEIDRRQEAIGDQGQELVQFEIAGADGLAIIWSWPRPASPPGRRPRELRD